MYNPEVEELINAALADGVLTEKEKQVLFKKAQAMGIDLDEFEMVLDARLVQLEKEEKEKVAKSAPKSNKIGDVRKCPQCGAVIGSFQMVCPECGFEFNNVGPNAFVEKFSTELQKITGEAGKINDSIFVSDKKKEKKQDRAIARAEAQFVKNYPLPMTKEDCVELLNFMMPKTRLAGSNVATRQWRLKADSILDKMENENPNNAKIQELCKSYREKLKISFPGKVKLWYTSMSRGARTTFWVLFGILVYIALIAVVESDSPDSQAKKVEQLVKSGDINGAKAVFREDGHKSSALYDYFMENGEYDEAAEFIPYDYFEPDEEAIFNYLKTSVTQMCKKEEFSAAERFIKRQIHLFDKYDDPDKWGHNEWNTTSVRNRLDDIIDSYR